MSNDSFRSIQFTGNIVDGEPEVGEKMLQDHMADNAVRPEDVAEVSGISYRWTDGEKHSLQCDENTTRGELEHRIMTNKVEGWRKQAEVQRSAGNTAMATKLEAQVDYYEEHILPANEEMLRAQGKFDPVEPDNDFEESLEALEALAEERHKESIKDRYR